MSLEQQALDRKARLAGLKRKRNQPEPTVVTKKSNIAESPTTETISENDELSSPPSFTQNGETVEAVTAQLEKQILASIDRQSDEASGEVEGVPRLTRYADFKRDLKEDLDILSHRTDTSIQEMIRAKLEKAQSAQNKL